MPSPSYRTGGANKDNVLGLRNELEFSKGADLFAIDAGLASKGKRIQRPAFGKIGIADTPFQSVFLARMPLCTHQARHKLGVRDVLFFGAAQLFLIDVEDAAELEILQQLIEFFIHRHLLLGD